jgi:hypothetical protein
LDCYDQAYIRSQPGFSHPSLLYEFDAANKTAAADYADGKISQDQFKAALARNFAALQQASENARAADLQNVQASYAQQQAIQAQQNADENARWQNFWGGLANWGAQQQPQQNNQPLSNNYFCVPINGGVSCNRTP